MPTPTTSIYSRELSAKKKKENFYQTKKIFLWRSFVWKWN